MTLLGLLSFIFGRVVVRENETYLYDSLLRRSQVTAAQISAERVPQRVPTQLSQDYEIGFLFEDGHQILPTAEFEPSLLRSLLPKETSSSSLITLCQSTKGEKHLCAFNYIDRLKAWAVDFTPKSTASHVLRKLAQEILGMGIALILIAMILSYFVSRALFKPLKDFAQASQKVAEGKYDEVQLPIFRKDEVGRYAVAFQKMIDNLKQREIRLAHSARLASIGQMGASIAHEVKNPLTSMMGYAKILSQKSTDPEMKEAAQIIASEADRCNQILLQMLRFSRNDIQERKPFSVDEVLQSSMALIKAEAKSAKVEIKADLKCNSIVIGNAQQTQQVILNVLLNALQSSRQSQAVKREAHEIELRSYEKSGIATIEIEDHAAGIPQGIQHKIFEPFFTTKDKKEGTGLGLSVALDIIRDHGGHIFFESQEGKGTVFVIQIPTADSAKASLDQSS